ncbi:hypothetical protein C8Q77DRAFT_1062937 [Trametes polyzona]|nr:hypothetical protein C8Q77DRAFT_1062937 [Trametes polyzona]
MTTADPATRPQLQLHRITTPDDDNIGRVLTLSNAIFSADESTKHGSLSYRRDQLSHPSSFIIYLTPTTSPPNDPVAFLFVLPRNYDPPLHNGATEGLHIWLAGVAPEWRAAGCLTTMVNELNDIGVLTVCTYPLRFPLMWKWLSRRGWLPEQEFADGKIMYSRR